jgi:hypothetical protein
MTCPIPHCSAPVSGPGKVCRPHYRLIPRPQQEALNHYAKHKGSQSHVASFARAVESVERLLGARRVEPVARVVRTPYRDD